MKDCRRLNVALTRARHSLWIVLNSKTFTANATWLSLITHCKEADCFKPAGYDRGLQQLVAVDSAVTQLSAKTSASKEITLRDCRWGVSFTKQAKTSIEALDASTVNHLVAKLLSLASGVVKRPKIQEVHDHKVNQFKVSNYLVLWSIELESCASHYQQLLHIWDIVEGGRAPGIHSHIQHILKSRTKTYLSACSQRECETVDGVRISKPVMVLSSNVVSKATS
jgi:ATP-dependent exoDNAse (exonuclease V) beta subunit